MNTTVKEYLEYITGDAFTVKFVVEGLDFTGKSVKSDFKKDINQASPDITFQTGGNGITVTVISATKAEVVFSKTPAQMAAITQGTYKYDIEVYTNANDVQTIGTGSLKVYKGITT